MKQNGVTLIELMIVIGFIAIIAAIAIPFFVDELKTDPNPRAAGSAPSAVCISGVKVMVNPNGDSYQLKDSSGNGIAC